MIFLSPEDLGINKDYSSSEVIFQDKLFTRGPDFSKKDVDAAIGFCEKYLHQGSYLLVDNKFYVSIWLQIRKSKDSITEKVSQVEPEFIRFCELKLSAFIGPIAAFMCEDVLNENPGITKTELVKTLASYIPETHRAIAFQEQIGSF